MYLKHKINGYQLSYAYLETVNEVCNQFYQKHYTDDNVKFVLLLSFKINKLTCSSKNIKNKLIFRKGEL